MISDTMSIHVPNLISHISYLISHLSSLISYLISSHLISSHLILSWGGGVKLDLCGPMDYYLSSAYYRRDARRDARREQFLRRDVLIIFVVRTSFILNGRYYFASPCVSHSVEPSGRGAGNQRTIPSVIAVEVKRT